MTAEGRTTAVRPSAVPSPGTGAGADTGADTSAATGAFSAPRAPTSPQRAHTRGQTRTFR